MSLKSLGSLRKGFKSKKHQRLVVATDIIKCFLFLILIKKRFTCVYLLFSSLLHLYIRAFCTKCSLFLPPVSYLWWLGMRVHPTCWSGVLRGKSIRYPSPCLETARSPLFVSNTRVWLTFSNKCNEPKVMLTNRVQLHIMKKTSSGHLRLWCESHSYAGRARLQRPEWRDHTDSLQWLVWTIAGGIVSLHTRFLTIIENIKCWINPVWPVAKLSGGLSVVIKAVSDRFISPAIFWYRSSLSSCWKKLLHSQKECSGQAHGHIHAKKSGSEPLMYRKSFIVLLCTSFLEGSL